MSPSMKSWLERIAARQVTEGQISAWLRLCSWPRRVRSSLTATEIVDLANRIGYVFDHGGFALTPEQVVKGNAYIARYGHRSNIFERCDATAPPLPQPVIDAAKQGKVDFRWVGITGEDQPLAIYRVLLNGKSAVTYSVLPWQRKAWR